MPILHRIDPRSALGSALVLLALVAALPSTGSAAPRPVPPAGYTVLAAGHVPTFCSGTYDAYAPTYGVYWDVATKAWRSAPSCYPRWGNLTLSPSLVTTAGKALTFTASSDVNSQRMRFDIGLAGGVPGVSDCRWAGGVTLKRS